MYIGLVRLVCLVGSFGLSAIGRLDNPHPNETEGENDSSADTDKRGAINIIKAGRRKQWTSMMTGKCERQTGNNITAESQQARGEVQQMHESAPNQKPERSGGRSNSFTQ